MAYMTYGARLRYVWCPFTVCMVPVYGMYGARLRYVWCPFTVCNRMVPIYGKLWCPFTVCMVPVYGMLVAGAKFEREKTALRDSQRSNFHDSLWGLYIRALC
jgi:hypothetical protein